MSLSESFEHNKNPDLWLREAFDSLAVPLFRLNNAGQFVEANQAAEQFLSLSVKSLRDKHIDQVFAESSSLVLLVNQVRERQLAVTGHKLELVIVPSQDKVTADVKASPLGDGGEVLVLLWPRTLAEKFDRQMNSQASALSISALSAVLAHEIKNPLTGISGAAQLIAQKLSIEDQKLTHLIRDEVSRIGRLVDQMMVFSDERLPEREAVNIHVVLEHVEALIKASFGDRIAFTLDYDPSLPFVWGNKDQLIQVILNLMKNAAEAVIDVNTPVIKLRTSFRSGLSLAKNHGGAKAHLPIECTIGDNGSGIPENLHHHVFEPFVTSKPAGKGLGLAFAAKVIHDHGGLIELESNTRGTQIALLLPAMVD